MKKNLLALGILAYSATLGAHNPIKGMDAELFLKPYLKEVSNQLVYEVGQQVQEKPSSLYDLALSLHKGGQLTRTIQTVSEGGMQVSGLGAHLREMADAMKIGGEAIISAPASYGIVFTDNRSKLEEVQAHIAQVLEAIGESHEAELIEKQLTTLSEVQRATFAFRNNHLTLITDEKELQIGEAIWYKTPEGAVPNFYHSEEEYLVAIHNAGLSCEEIKRPCFFGKVKYDQYRATLPEGEVGLGEAYMTKNPFTLYYVVKKG